MNEKTPFQIMSVNLAEKYRSGDWTGAYRDLRSMSDFLMSEEKYTDAMKCLMLAFHFLASPQTLPLCVEANLVTDIRKAFALSGMTYAEVFELYVDVIREDTFGFRKMSFEESFYCFFLLL